jgi:hypothetical protein
MPSEVVYPPEGERGRPLRLCAAIVDRLTFGGNIIETGTDCYRLAHTKAALAAMTTNQAAQAETLTRRGKR